MSPMSCWHANVASFPWLAHAEPGGQWNIMIPFVFSLWFVWVDVCASQSTNHFDPDWNISTIVGWTAAIFNYGYWRSREDRFEFELSLVTFPVVPPVGQSIHLSSQWADPLDGLAQCFFVSVFHRYLLFPESKWTNLWYHKVDIFGSD